jgi:hypothetical protein
MLQPVAKYVGGKMLTAILTVAVVLVVIWYWRLDPAAREALWSSVRAVLVWLGFVAVFPWALFLVPPMIVRAESNAVSAAALLGYLLVDVLFAFWLAGWSVSGTLIWALLILGFLAAGVYNFIVCEYLAERAEP